MSVRTHFPSAKEPESHFFFTVSRGGRQKRFALRPGVLYGLVGGLPLIGAIYLGATAYMFFRDDMVAALMARQTRQAVAEADAVVFVVDIRAGLSAQDHDIARYLRTVGKTVVLAANKAEGMVDSPLLGEFSS